MDRIRLADGLRNLPASAREDLALRDADLLGYADPRLLGAIAGGGLFGLGGYAAMNRDAQ